MTVSSCGHSASEVFVRTSPGFGLDDTIFLPGYIDFSIDAVSFQTTIGKSIQLKTPIISHPAVTGARMATAMALLGGLGIVGGTGEAQLEAVSKVKRFENGFINDPVTLSVDSRVGDVDNIKRKFGFSTVPVVDENKRLAGLVTSRDIDFISDRVNTRLADVMTPLDKLITLKFPVTLADANAKLRQSKVGKLPILDDQGRLVALVSRNDLLKNKEYPLASKDTNKQLLVGAAVDVVNSDHVAKLVHAGVDVLYLEGDCGSQVTAARNFRARFANVAIIGTDVSTSAELFALGEAGVDAVTISGARAQATSIFQLAAVARSRGVSVIGNPGVRNSGHVVKTLALGGDAVLVNRLFESTKEQRGNDGHGVSVAGEDGSKGSIMQLIPYYMQGAKHGFQDLGARTLQDLHRMLESGELRMEIRSGNAVKEGNVHDLLMVNRQ